jgi:hypothetical protein
MLLGEIVVYAENCIEHINTLWVENAEVLMLKQFIYVVTTMRLFICFMPYLCSKCKKN